HRGAVNKTGIRLGFPEARTGSLPDYGWVWGLKSECELYDVTNFVNSGEALVDHNGFFARETQVVQVRYSFAPRQYSDVVIDGPFLVFFADDTGVHAAAWFTRDAFTLK